MQNIDAIYAHITIVQYSSPIMQGAPVHNSDKKPQVAISSNKVFSGRLFSLKIISGECAVNHLM